MAKKNGILDLIRQTPLVKLDRIASEGVEIYGKLESIQPGGSVKDRAALQIIRDAIADGRLKKGQTVIEMTSGNMGAGLAVVCRQFGCPFIAFMPEGNSPERIKVLKAFGAEVRLVKQVDGAAGRVTGKDIAYASEMAKAYAAEIEGYYVDQFNNPSSIKGHLESTGPEIWNDLPELDAFITAIGSGGTFLGTSKYLKSIKPDIFCAAVEPEKAAIIKTGRVIDPRHIIQGTGYSLVPPHWETALADDIITVSDDEVAEMTRRLSHEQGLFVGYSSGANVAAALKLWQANPALKKIVTVLCDSGYKYGSL